MDRQGEAGCMGEAADVPGDLIPQNVAIVSIV